MSLLYGVAPLKNQQGVPFRNDSNVLFKLNPETGIKDFISPGKSEEQIRYDYLNYYKLYYTRILNQVSKNITGRKISPHMLRHSKAQHLLDSGMSIDKLKTYLGHSQISSTEVYVQASAEAVKKELMALNKISKGNLEIIPHYEKDSKS
jgi:integrase